MINNMIIDFASYLAQFPSIISSSAFQALPSNGSALMKVVFDH